MSASEVASVIEGWATLAGLVVVTAGAVFAGVQLRAEATSRRLQAVATVLTDVRPVEAVAAWRIVRRLPDGFQFAELGEEERRAAVLVASSYARLGNMLLLGAVREDDIFPDLALSRGALEAWEKVKHIWRDGQFPTELAPGLGQGLGFEQLAAGAQAWLLRNGESKFGRVAHFDADWEALGGLGERVKAARASAR